MLVVASVGIIAVDSACRRRRGGSVSNMPLFRLWQLGLRGPHTPLSSAFLFTSISCSGSPSGTCRSLPDYPPSPPLTLPIPTSFSPPISSLPNFPVPTSYSIRFLHTYILSSPTILSLFHSTVLLEPVLRIRDVFPDPGFGSDFFPSRIRIFSIPDPGSASKNLSILTQKNGF